MSIYTEAMDEVMAEAMEAMSEFMEENFPELTPDKDAIKAEFERYFNDGTENGAILEQQLMQKYGPEEFQRQWTLKARRTNGRSQ